MWRVRGRGEERCIQGLDDGKLRERDHLGDPGVDGVIIQCVALATEPGISLIILTPMKILQRNLNRSTFVV